jgi:hypothetical protein
MQPPYSSPSFTGWRWKAYGRGLVPKILRLFPDDIY